MSIMITEVYDALISAGADEQKAKKAAEAISEHRDDIKQLKYLTTGLYIVGASAFAYTFSLLGAILDKI